MRLAVVGSRDYPPDRYWIVRDDILNVGHGVGWDNLVIVSGGARGVDSMAAQAAKDFDVPLEVYPADWRRLGRRAGMVRNQQIVDAADELFAYFDRERTPGTEDSIRRALAKGIPVSVSEQGRQLEPVA